MNKRGLKTLFYFFKKNFLFSAGLGFISE
jgi:hypothetical protein